jgi:two-component system nitrate/nitrite response regulator NarL
MEKRAQARPQSVHVALISPLRLLCEALQRVLAKDRSLRVIAHGLSVAQIAECGNAIPNLIVLIDGSSPMGLRLLRATSNRLKHCRLIVFGLSRSRDYQRARGALGARGLVDRAATLEDLIAAIRSVGQGSEFVSAALASDMKRDKMMLLRPSSKAALTARELEVAELLARDLPNKQIGSRLRISEHTVKIHVRHIFAKLQICDRRAVAAAWSR